MSAPVIELTKGNGLMLSGELTFDTVNSVRQQGMGLLSSDGPDIIDLKGVTHSDSAGIALLLEWLREAKRLNKHIHFINMPQQMQAIAKVSGLQELLPVQ